MNRWGNRGVYLHNYFKVRTSEFSILSSSPVLWLPHSHLSLETQKIQKVIKALYLLHLGYMFLIWHCVGMSVGMILLNVRHSNCFLVPILTSKSKRTQSACICTLGLDFYTVASTALTSIPIKICLYAPKKDKLIPEP